MKKKEDVSASNFGDSNELNEQIKINIENFVKNHVREGAVGRGQNMAARKDSWNPIAMKDQNINPIGQQPSA